jgi:hypothetical protein
MRDFDSNGLTLADHDANAMPMSVVVSRVAEDEADPDQDLSQTELAKLRSSIIGCGLKISRYAPESNG